jgi:hypothetical protein
MKVGAEPKKLAILGALVLVGGYAFYSNVLSQPGPPAEQESAAPRPGATATPPAGSPVPAAAPAARRASTRVQSGEFRPSLRPRRPEDRLDPMSIDPTLRLDLLAKVQEVELDGGARNLFQFSAPPAIKTPEPKIIPKLPGESANADEEPPPEAGPPKPPPPPSITLKYYGYSVVRGENRKKAFFLDGDEILVAAEGETLKRRYRVVRIGLTSVVMEDTESKDQQTLPLVEEAAAG